MHTETFAVVELHKNEQGHSMARVILFDQDEDTDARSVKDIILHEAAFPRRIFMDLADHRESMKQFNPNTEIGVAVVTPEHGRVTELNISVAGLDDASKRFIGDICRSFARGEIE